MKSIYTYTSVTVLVAACVLISGCGGGEGEKSKQEKVTKLLISSTWQIQSVTVDDTDKTSIYQGLTLRFATSTYTSTNGIPVWPANGSWTYTHEDATAFIRDDDTEITIIEVTSNALKLGLTWDETTIGSGRHESVEGYHVFSFTR